MNTENQTDKPAALVSVASHDLLGDRILAHLRTSPAESKRDMCGLRAALSAPAEQIRECLIDLIVDGKVRVHGNGKRHVWSAVPPTTWKIEYEIPPLRAIYYAEADVTTEAEVRAMVAKEQPLWRIRKVIPRYSPNDRGQERER